jgi:hypothetical protein
MANAEQLEILKKGVEAWNEWRKENPNTEIDLIEADLRGADLRKANLKGADLEGADLEGAILSRANLIRTNLSGTNLSGTNLSEVELWGADIRGTNLRGAYIQFARLYNMNLLEADLADAFLEWTVFGNVDLSETKGLEDVRHVGPSQISTDTLQRSKGQIPAAFLRGCGLSDWEVESAKLYQPGLSAKEINDIVYRIYDLRANQAIQINPLFISYSHRDGVFVDEMENHLNEKGIRFWRDIHAATAGRLEKVVDRAMRLNPTVLLVLSENSVKSDWVEHEARSARELEKELKRDVLCPVALDGAWKDCSWPERLREQIMEYNILDFSNWKDEEAFEKKFRKLIDGLDLFYKE